MDTKESKKVRYFFENKEGEKVYIQYPVSIPSPPGFCVCVGEDKELIYTIERSRIKIEKL